MQASAKADRWRRAAPTLAAMIVAGGFLGAQLLMPPVVGLANNGDFESVMGYVGFQYTTDVRAEKYFNWINTKFAFGPPGWFKSGLLTSETPIAWLARLVSEPFADGGLFDLRVLGTIHASLLVVGLGLLVSATAPLSMSARLVGATLLVFFFTDVGYAAPLNTFLSQAASIVFLLLTLGIAARTIATGRRGPLAMTLFFVFAALFVGSKPQEVIQAPLLSFFGLRLYGHGFRRLHRQPATWAAIALCGFSVWYFRQTPPLIAEVARYHKVFMELLPNSPEPERDLADLGLESSWVTAAGRIAYAPGSPYSDAAFRSAFLERFSYPRLLRFYATHPSRLASTLRRGGRDALRLRHPRFGNLEHRPGVEAGAKASAFSAWSSARLSLPGHPLLWIGPFLALNVAAAAATYRRATAQGKLVREGIVLLAVMATSALLVCILANAHGDLPRHFYVFHALSDLLLAADAVWLTQALGSRPCPRVALRSVQPQPERLRQKHRHLSARVRGAGAVVAAAAARGDSFGREPLDPRRKRV